MGFILFVFVGIWMGDFTLCLQFYLNSYNSIISNTMAVADCFHWRLFQDFEVHNFDFDIIQKTLVIIKVL
jgi:hypothetical protein